MECWVSILNGERVNKMFGKLKCFFGWHRFRWKFEGKPLRLEPPPHAQCVRCGIQFGKAPNNEVSGAL